MSIEQLSVFRYALLALTVIVAVSLFILGLKKQKSTRAIIVSVFAVFLIIGTVASVYQSTFLFPKTDQQKFLIDFLTGLIYLCITAILSTLLALTITFSNPRKIISYKIILSLIPMPVIFQAWFWVQLLNSQGNRRLWTIQVSHWILFQLIYLLLLSFVSVILWLQLLNREKKIPRIRFIPLFASLLLTIAVLLGNLVKLIPILVIFFSYISTTMGRLETLIPFSYIDFLFGSFTIIGLAILQSVFRTPITDQIPPSYRFLTRDIQEAWMLLDENNVIVDMNTAAEKIIRTSSDKIIGKNAGLVLQEWPTLLEKSAIGRSNLNKRSIYEGQSNREAYIFPLESQETGHQAQLIIWQEISEKKRQEFIQQHAREEMFILLHSISEAASRAIGVDDFVKTCNYQIAYSFPCHASLIFLFKTYDEANQPEQQTKDQGNITLAAQHGLWEYDTSNFPSIKEFYKLIDALIQTGETLQINNPSKSDLTPDFLNRMEISSLLCLPMIADEKILGMLLLTRQHTPAFNSDEIVRLSLVLEQVSAFIQTDRQRHLTISLNERQRLVRDLHDSVSQKLYGLVTLTEAAQAGIETKTLDNPTKVLSRIGENARQALKEMRLFLYQMQPVNLEKEGLVSVLNHRLAAVEGRADVTVRLLSDDRIILDSEKELALYYIAQEALNNAMKHANARSVIVYLNQKRVNTILEIEDDGVGFDPKNNPTGGLGLNNIRERAAQIGAKVKLTSSPGNGTKISVVVRHVEDGK
ncbi:MAG: GAF domain-containing protein [Anaerolineales bacterium]|nr:GAF domain-containing protein [Anaerolineales bacterium]